jgi:hypothetical protein
MKKPSEKNDMLSQKNLNTKALHELILYYLTELEGPDHNNAIRYLIASNGYDWFIFEETLFRQLFATKKFISNEYTATGYLLNDIDVVITVLVLTLIYAMFKASFYLYI